jgi:hypothetical protein
MKCYVCKSGNLVASGCHEYCDNCSFSRFIVTENYIDSCVALLGELVSNTRFDNEVALSKFVFHQIKDHLPKLHSFMEDVADSSSFVYMLMDGIKSQSINLQIDSSMINAKEDDSFKCSCGSESAQQLSAHEIVCTQCGCKYFYSEENGRYEPEFICECGCTSYEQEDGSALANCTQCYTLYVHDEVHSIFRRVVK